MAMKHRSVSHRTRLAVVFVMWAALLGVATVAVNPCARADVVAYLVNVHVRPGYNFPNADASEVRREFQEAANSALEGARGH